MDFTEAGEEIVSSWEPRQHFQGYLNVLHGGIQATLMDEIASWFVYVKLKSAGVTSKAEIRYFKPLFVDHGKLAIRASLGRMRRNLADINVKIFNESSELCSEGIITYFTVSAGKAKQTLYYPGHEAFYRAAGPGK